MWIWRFGGRDGDATDEGTEMTIYDMECPPEARGLLLAVADSLLTVENGGDARDLFARLRSMTGTEDLAACEGCGEEIRWFDAPKACFTCGEPTPTGVGVLDD